MREKANVHSVSYSASPTGQYFVNFATAMPDANYCVTGSSGGQSGTSTGSVYQLDTFSIGTTNAAKSTVMCPIGTLNSAGSLVDTPQVAVAIFR
jgi:hypothetical protein